MCLIYFPSQASRPTKHCPKVRTVVALCENHALQARKRKTKAEVEVLRAGKNNSVYLLQKPRIQGFPGIFAMGFGNSVRTVLAGKLHVLWRKGMGQQDAFGLSGLAARFITLSHPSRIRIGDMRCL